MIKLVQDKRDNTRSQALPSLDGQTSRKKKTIRQEITTKPESERHAGSPAAIPEMEARKSLAKAET